MTDPTQTLKNSIAHAEAVELTLTWVKEMLTRLPALEAAVKAGAVQGVSAAHDVAQFKAAIKCLGYFTPSEAVFYKSHSVATLKAKLAALEAAQAVCTLPECPECDARPSPPNWSAPIPYRHVHERPAPRPVPPPAFRPGED